MDATKNWKDFRNNAFLCELATTVISSYVMIHNVKEGNWNSIFLYSLVLFGVPLMVNHFGIARHMKLFETRKRKTRLFFRFLNVLFILAFMYVTIELGTEKRSFPTSSDKAVFYVSLWLLAIYSVSVKFYINEIGKNYLIRK